MIYIMRLVMRQEQEINLLPPATTHSVSGNSAQSFVCCRGYIPAKQRKSTALQLTSASGIALHPPSQEFRRNIISILPLHIKQNILSFYPKRLCAVSFPCLPCGFLLFLGSFIINKCTHNKQHLHGLHCRRTNVWTNPLLLITRKVGPGFYPRQVKEICLFSTAPSSCLGFIQSPTQWVQEQSDRSVKLAAYTRSPWLGNWLSTGITT
jgi:hypothetical protein